MKIISELDILKNLITAHTTAPATAILQAQLERVRLEVEYHLEERQRADSLTAQMVAEKAKIEAAYAALLHEHQKLQNSKPEKS